jgi:hypothetical protein
MRKISSKLNTHIQIKDKTHLNLITACMHKVCIHFKKPSYSDAVDGKRNSKICYINFKQTKKMAIVKFVQSIIYCIHKIKP